MTRDRPLIRLAVGIASVATVAVLAPMAKAGNYAARAGTNERMGRRMCRPESSRISELWRSDPGPPSGYASAANVSLL